jgi:hypothetical protein
MAEGFQPFEHVYLEDSYFLGLYATGSQFRFRVLFVLTVDHPAYEPPKSGEQHCYREGEIVIDGLVVSEWRKGSSPRLGFDPDGSVDLGGFLFTEHGEGYRVETEWFEMNFTARSLTLALEDVG